MSNHPNSSSPVARLAPELLCAVFDHLDLHARLYATHVSVSWRARAASCARLWTALLFDGFHYADVDMLQLFLSRTKDAPVTLRIDCPDEENAQRFARILAQHMYHTASLSVRLYLGCWELIYTAFLVPAPLLTSLAFTGATDARVPEGLFAGHAPLLASLDVVGFELPSRCPALALVSSFCARVDNTNDAVAAQEVRYMYHVMPRLRRLELQGLYERVSLPAQPQGHALSHVHWHSDGMTTYPLAALRLSDVETLVLADASCDTFKEIVDVQPRLASAEITRAADRRFNCQFACASTNWRRTVTTIQSLYLILLLRRTGALLHVQSVAVDESAAGFLYETDLPVLSQLTLHIEASPDMLSPLRREILAARERSHRTRIIAAPMLRTIAVRAAPRDGGRRLSGADVQTLLVALAGEMILSSCNVRLDGAVLEASDADDISLKPIRLQCHAVSVQD